MSEAAARQNVREGIATYERNTPMTNFELDDIEAALVVAPPSTSTRGRAATISAIAAADRQGLIDVAVATVDSPVGDLLVAASRRVSCAWLRSEHVLDDLAERISPRVVESPVRLDPVAASSTSTSRAGAGPSTS